MGEGRKRRSQVEQEENCNVMWDWIFPAHACLDLRH